ncbi:AbiV family abortive infection protein [Acidisoma sp. L85]|jgi:AbiV family abortive infection protein|uniref:AbiV family abortive infection protein n=1 Tax=Acidisoma sp. L85 TaxID=1641850 RepID=UPI00131C8883|nr:AbiV family abortive infection protein [Acidisoma sp. L85]
MNTATYQGAVSASQAAAGMNAALRNSRRLLGDAELLLSAERWASAASLAVLGLEEAGKMSVIRVLCTTTEPAALKKQWKDYHLHQAKMEGPIGFNPDGKVLTAPNDLKAAIAERTKLIKQIDKIKQSGLYTDCYPDSFGKPYWVEPVTQVTEDAARDLVAILSKLLSDKPDVSVREMELFHEYISPALDDLDKSKRLVRWMVAMEAEGLMSRDETENRLRRFYDGIFGEGWYDTFNQNKPSPPRVTP